MYMITISFQYDNSFYLPYIQACTPGLAEKLGALVPSQTILVIII